MIKYAGIYWNKVSRKYMPIFIEIAPRIFKILRFELNIPYNENHKFTIFQTNQYGERKRIIRCYPFNYITFHFKSTLKSIRILQNIFEK